MNTTTATTIERQSLDNSVINEQSLQNSTANLKHIETLDETELELERIMFEEFAHGLPSDIPMADF
jgi:hypothetical protein